MDPKTEDTGKSQIIRWGKCKAISANPGYRELNFSAMLQEANLCSGYRARFGLINCVEIIPHPLVTEIRCSPLMPAESNQSPLMEPWVVQNKCVCIACDPLHQRVRNSQAMYRTFQKRWWGCEDALVSPLVAGVKVSIPLRRWLT